MDSPPTRHKDRLLFGSRDVGALVEGHFGDWVAVLGPYIAFGLPLTVLLLRAYFISIPNELSDAALIDKATGPHHLFHMLTEESDVRLHMTRRLIELS